MEDFPLFKKEIAQSESAIFNNIAFAYGRDENEKMQIEFCTKTIDRSPYIQDIGILIKAYLRRGLAYESSEKYKKAANDLKMVRDLDNQNKQAQTGLQRVLKYIKQDEGIDYIPQIDDKPLPELKAAPVTPKAAAPVTPVTPKETIKATPPVAETPK